MKISSTTTVRLIVAGAIMTVTLQTLSAQTEYRKLAQTGMKFLALGAGARQAALGDAFTSVPGNSSAMFYNTAGMAFQTEMADVAMANTQWIADIVHNHVSVAFAPWDGDLGVIGLSYQAVDYGEIEATVLAANPKGYLDVGTIKPTAYALGIGYAIALTDRFSLGGNIKLVGQNLGSSIVSGTPVLGGAGEETGFTPTETKENKLDNIPTFDFGVLYRTGMKSLNFGLSVRNFAREVSYVKENFQLPLTFRMGLSMNVLDFVEIEEGAQRLLVVAEAEHPRDFTEQIKLGAEYVFANTIALRIGYVSPADEYSVSYGFGLQTALLGTSLGVDYAYTPFTHFDPVQRVSVRFGF